MDWSLLPKLFATLLALIGSLAVIIGLPGTFLAWLGVAVYALSSRFATISGWLLLGTFFGCIFIELADNIMSGLLVKKFGASKGSMLMAVVGGFGGSILVGTLGGIGGFFGSAIGSVIGAFVGSYAAVYWWERYRLNRTHEESAKSAFATVLGRLLVMFFKLVWIGWLISIVW
ncbi:MAG: DUF456 domain-containing protein [Armatimonadetes bacterium]|nr:DUF456 domain-containing protein [Armatimonadota bacterium]